MDKRRMLKVGGTRIPHSKRALEPEPRCYRIIRFRQSGSRRTVRSNVTLTEAQAHCSDPKTKGISWFDGFEYMAGCRPE